MSTGHRASVRPGGGAKPLNTAELQSPGPRKVQMTWVGNSSKSYELSPAESHVQATCGQVSCHLSASSFTQHFRGPGERPSSYPTSERSSLSSNQQRRPAQPPRRGVERCDRTDTCLQVPTVWFSAGASGRRGTGPRDAASFMGHLGGLPSPPEQLRSASWSLTKSPVASLALGGSCRDAIRGLGPGGGVCSFVRSGLLFSQALS